LDIENDLGFRKFKTGENLALEETLKLVNLVLRDSGKTSDFGEGYL